MSKRMDRRSAINTHYMRLIFGACLAALVFSESFSVKLTSFHVGSVLRLRGARGNAYDGKEWLLHEWEEGDFDRSEEAPAEEVNKEREEISSMDSSDSDIIVNTTKVKSDEDMKNELAEALKGLSFNTSETGESFNYSETMYNFGISKEYLEKEVFTGAHKRELKKALFTRLMMDIQTPQWIIDEKERIKNGTYRAMAPIPGTAVPYAQPTGLWRPGMDPDDPKFASAGPAVCGYSEAAASGFAPHNYKSWVPDAMHNYPKLWEDDPKPFAERLVYNATDPEQGNLFEGFSDEYWGW
mmetsp:Transcript_11522/g.26351  ORF Transcript_11522/g.26351 Transcript_11522/m.26351 type:complete len:297 (-) Transcript_11522:201-1091(-)